MMDRNGSHCALSSPQGLLLHLFEAAARPAGNCQMMMLPSKAILQSQIAEGSRAIHDQAFYKLSEKWKLFGRQKGIR